MSLEVFGLGVNSTVFRCVIPYSVADMYRHIGGTCCLYLQGKTATCTLIWRQHFGTNGIPLEKIPNAAYFNFLQSVIRTWLACELTRWERQCASGMECREGSLAHLYITCETLLASQKYKGRGKAVPLQAWTDPEGSRKLRLPDFVTTA